MMRWPAIFCVITVLAKGQAGIYINGNDASLRVDTGTILFVDGDLVNLNCDPLLQVRMNGSLVLTGSIFNHDSLKFLASSSIGHQAALEFVSGTSASNSTISGNVPPQLWRVNINKTVGDVILTGNVICRDTLIFISGHILMNGYNWRFVDPVGAPLVINHPYSKGENHLHGFKAISLTDSGTVKYNTIFTSSTLINPANLGLIVKGPLDIGSPLSITRGFMPQINAAQGGLCKYFDIESPDYDLESDTVSLFYHDGDLSLYPNQHFQLSKLAAMVSPGSDMDWTHLSSLAISVALSPSIHSAYYEAALSMLNHPNTSINPRHFRLTIADQACGQLPVSALIQDTIHICAGNTVTLDAGNQSPVANTSLKWEWDLQPPDYSRAIVVSPGQNYRVIRLHMKDVRGCENSDSVVVAPSAPFPVVRYLNFLNACQGDSVSIKDTITISSGTFINLWQFSDGSAGHSTQSLFRHLLTGAGAFIAQLRATSDHSCATTQTFGPIAVYPPPHADFTYSTNCTLRSQHFTSTSIPGSSTAIIVGYDWNIQTSITHGSILTQSFSPGTYQVKHKITTHFGCRDSITKPITILPQEQATFNIQNICADDSLLIQSGGCVSGNCSYQWDFGDGSADTARMTSHVYSNGGLYNVKLIVHSNTCPDSVQFPLVVNPTPVASFAVSKRNVCVNEPVYFNNNSIGNIATCSWMIGGINSTQYHAAGSFSAPGVMYIQLTVVSDSGCVSVDSNKVTVHLPPISILSATPVCENNLLKVFCITNAIKPIYQWHVNGVLSALNSATFSTAQPAGNPTIQVMVTDTIGCSDTTIVVCQVKKIPVAPFQGTLSTCGTQYILDAGNPGSNFTWLPGQLSQQTMTVSKNGLYQVTITNSLGCNIISSALIRLNEQVEPKLGNDTTVCGYRLLDAGYPGSHYLWSTGETTQVIRLSNSGSVSVIVTDQNQCVGADTILLNVLALPTINLGRDTILCKPLNGFNLQTKGYFAKCLWNTGDTARTLVCLHSGAYVATVSALNACTEADTINIQFKETPFIQLGNDTVVCDQLVLNARNFDNEIRWQDGSTSQQYTINSSGIYYATATNSVSQCHVSDTVFVDVDHRPALPSSLDTTVCQNSGFTFVLNFPDSWCTWNTGTHSHSLVPKQTGLYASTVTSEKGCSNTFYGRATLIPVQNIVLEKHLTYLCGGKTVLQAEAEGTILWWRGEKHAGSGRSLDVEESGFYKITADDKGCEALDSILVIPTTQTVLADFLVSSIDTVNTPIQFVNLSEGNDLHYQWTFGDGFTSNDMHPLHNYEFPVDPVITLNVSNAYCTDQISKSLHAVFRSMPPPKKESDRTRIMSLHSYPNPFTETFWLEMNLSKKASVDVEISDVQGHIVLQFPLEPEKDIYHAVQLPSNSAGIYYVTVTPQGSEFTGRKTITMIRHQ